MAARLISPCLTVPRSRRLLAGILVAAGLSGSAQADDGGWASQSFDALTAGWNPIWLSVEPADNAPATVFSGVLGELDAVWAFVPGRTPTDRGRWLVFDPDAPEFVNTLDEIQGGRFYLVHMANAPVGDLVVVGRPARRTLRLSAQHGGFVGSTVDEGAPPELQEFFAFGAALDRVTGAYEFDPALGANGEWTALSGALLEPLESGAAYWASVSSTSDYDGALRVSAGSEGIQFGGGRYLAPLLIELPVVEDVGGRDVTVRVLDSAAPPAGAPAVADPGLAGGTSAWLQYLDPVLGEWTDFAGAGITLNIPEGASSTEIMLRANRAAVDAVTVDADGSMYQGLVEISDDQGHVITLAAGMEKAPDAGTWVGEVALDEVSLHPELGGDGTPLPAPALDMAVILELPEEGTSDPARLMDQVCLEVVQDGSTYSSVYSSVMMSEDLDLVEISPGIWEGVTTMPADHPLNPYRHRYNPKHRDGYAITRTITITMLDADPDPGSGNANEDAFRALRNAAIGNNQLIGTYEETITGLLRASDAITVRGTFRVFRLARERQLDGGC